MAETDFVQSRYVTGDMWHYQGDYSRFFFRWQQAFMIQFERLEIFEHAQPTARLGPAVPDADVRQAHAT